MLAVHNLKFLDYGPISFTVGAGEGISIQGESGAGKSLLLRAITDLDLHTGEVSLNGQTQDSMPAPQWRQKTGYLLADAIFWSDTAEEILSVQQTTFLQQAIQTLHAESLLQKPVVQLSSGEKQRLALLRLLANKPEALLLDEPTSHLDPNTTLAAEAIIADYQHTHQCPLILVSHDKKQRTRMAGKHFILQEKTLGPAA